MKIFKRAHRLFNYLLDLQQSGMSVAFFPTMGALHIGHLSLLRQASEIGDISLASIFVNPTQFNDPNDLDKYPRPIAKDIDLLVSHDCDVLFLPDATEIYPADYQLLDYDIGYPNTVLEAKYREGHFNGVVNVVKRLLDICHPDYLLMGQKDYQQQFIIHDMIQSYGLPVKLVTCPIVREDDGLAFSSRNVRLTPMYRRASSCLYESLNWIKDHIKEFEVPYLLEYGGQIIAKRGLKLEYLTIVNGETLRPVLDVTSVKKCVVLVAAYAGEIRLIDNMMV